MRTPRIHFYDYTLFILGGTKQVNSCFYEAGEHMREKKKPVQHRLRYHDSHFMPKLSATALQVNLPA